MTQGFPNEATRASGRPSRQTCSRFGCPLRPAATLRWRTVEENLREGERVVVAHDTGVRGKVVVMLYVHMDHMDRKLTLNDAEDEGASQACWARASLVPVGLPPSGVVHFGVLFGVACSHHIFRRPVSNDQFALACIQTPG